MWLDAHAHIVEPYKSYKHIFSRKKVLFTSTKSTESIARWNLLPWTFAAEVWQHQCKTCHEGWTCGLEHNGAVFCSKMQKVEHQAESDIIGAVRKKRPFDILCSLMAFEKRAIFYIHVEQQASQEWKLRKPFQSHPTNKHITKKQNQTCFHILDLWGTKTCRPRGVTLNECDWYSCPF